MKNKDLREKIRIHHSDMYLCEEEKYKKLRRDYLYRKGELPEEEMKQIDLSIKLSNGTATYEDWIETF